MTGWTQQSTTSDTAAASGMTTGLPSVSSQRQAEMMQVRARSQAARPEAERAAMERSAEEALERKSKQQILQEVRETKRLKQEAATQLQHQRAANAYQGVSARELNSWADDSGRVKVERGVPPQVLRNLPPEEEEIEEAEEGGFHPLRRTKRAARGAARATGGAAGAVMGAAKKGVSWIPGVGEKETETGITATPRTREESSGAYDSEGGDDSPGMLRRIPLVGGIMNRNEDGAAEEMAPVAEEEKRGFFHGVTSHIPLVGRRNDTEEMVEAPAEPAPVVVGQNGANGQPMLAPTPTPAPAPVPAATPAGEPFIGPAGSAASGDPSEMAASGEGEKEGGFFKKLPLVGSRHAGESAEVATADQMAPPAAKDKAGIGGGLKNMFGKVIPGRSTESGPEIAGGSGIIDSGLFPQEGEPEQMMADESAGRRKFFKRPKLPDLPEISIPKPNHTEMPKPETPVAKKPRSPVHSGGNAYYVVKTDGAQFMRFAGGPLGSEALSLNAGTRVKMTKVGDDWSSVQLSNGSAGVIRNSDLKPAGPGEAGGGGIASSPPLPNTGGLATTSSGGARITAPVSATGAGISDTPGPPVSIPVSNLSGGGLPTGTAE